MRYLLLLSYDGTDFSGWQRQPGKRTVQSVLEDAAFQIFGQETQVTASGRTDAGVHALAQTASFAADTELAAAEIREYLNRYLPEDIAVTALEEAPDRFHARLNAVCKTYVYRLWTGDCPNVFERKYMYSVGAVTDIDAMRAAALALIGEHDFIGFSSLKKSKKSTVRTIYSIDISQNGAELRLTFTGSGFLYNMVRILSGTLLEVGQGKRSAQAAALPLSTLDRADAGPTLPARGLTLLKVDY